MSTRQSIPCPANVSSSSPVHKAAPLEEEPFRPGNRSAQVPSIGTDKKNKQGDLAASLELFFKVIARTADGKRESRIMRFKED